MGAPCQGVNVVKGDASDPVGLTAAFSGATSAYIIVPGVEARTALGLAAIAAARAAGVGHLTLQSVVTADVVSTVFGAQFHPLEAAARKSGLPLTILRLPLFTDNIWGQADAVKGAGKFFYPTAAAAPYSSVTTDNAGEAGAVVVANPRPHVGKTYNVVGPAYTNADLAAAFTAALGKPVEYVQVSYEAARASFLEKGWPEWQVRPCAA
jgi:NAD(P)H dehydrogenase (quinone)